MALAETAVLAVELKLAGAQQFKAGISEADAAAANLGRTTKTFTNALGGTASNFSLVKQAAVSTGQAIGGMATHFKNIITGPLGLIGLGAGLFTVAGAIHEGIGEAQSFGLEVQKLQALTGQSVENVSAMAAALDHFGISGDAAIKTVGMLTKNIGNIVNSKAGLAGFAATFGLSLTDSKGKLVSINEEILRTADYFNNKSIPATEKAAGLAKLYGRSWQQLIPFLSAGRKGILEAEQAAKDLGLTLTAQNLTDLKQYRENFLTLGDAVKGLQLQVGLVLVPVLADLAKGITGFLRDGGREKVVGFFRDAVKAAKDLGAVITGTVIPTLSGLASTAKGFWDAIPAPLRDILLKGFIADRTIHFLFGVSPLNLGKNLLGDIAGPVVRTLIANRLVPQPVVIVGGGVPGLPGGPGSIIPEAAGLGLTGLLSFIAPLAVAAVAPLAIFAALEYINGPGGIEKRDLAGRQATAAARGLDPANVPTSGGRGTTNVYAGWKAAQDAAKNLGQDMEKLRGTFADALKTRRVAAKDDFAAFIASAKARGFTFDPHAAASTSLASRFAFLGAGHSGSKDVAVANALASHFETGGSPLYTSDKNLKEAIKAVASDIRTLPAKFTTPLTADLVRLKNELARRTADAAVKTAAASRAAGIQAAAAIRDKDLSVTIPVSTYVNGRLLTSQIGRYSTTQQLQNLAGNLRG